MGLNKRVKLTEIKAGMHVSGFRKTCQVCGDPFMGNDSDKYCSRRCNYMAKDARRRAKMALVRGKEWKYGQNTG